MRIVPKGTKRGRPKTTGKWLGLRQLALTLDVHRDTLTRYLARPDSPTPNEEDTYNVGQVRRYLKRVGYAQGKGSDAQELKNEKIRVDIELAKFKFEQEKGDWVKKSEIEGAIGPLVAEAAELVRQKFERELPSQYKGKTQAECQKLNQDAIDKIFSQLREGVAAVVVSAA